MAGVSWTEWGDTAAGARSPAMATVQRPGTVRAGAARQTVHARVGGLMSTDPTMRIVWYQGKPYAVSSTPFGPSEPATDWHVLMPSGWLPLIPYRPGDDWQSVERRIFDWLDQGDATTR